MLVYSLRSRQPVTPHAFGATLGQQHLKPLLVELGGATKPEVVLLDFEGIEAATASYLKATLIYLLKAGRASAEGPESPFSGTLPPPLNVFPMVANLSPDVSEELDELLGSQRLPVLQATDWSEDTSAVQCAMLRGPLDEALRQSVECLSKTGQRVSATELATRFREDVRISETGWNNRLAELHRLRLVRRTKEGRQWLYELISREVSKNG